MKSVWLRRSSQSLMDQLNSLRTKLNPFHFLLHPFDGFDRVKEENKGSIFYAGLIVIIYFFAAIYQRQNLGYIFNHNQLSELNIYLIALKTIVMFALWAVSNWAVATWMDGEGKASEIVIVSAYAIIPYVASVILSTMLSNVIVANEGAFLGYITVVGILWSSILMIIGLMIIHDYEFVKTLRSMVLTLVAMLIITFLVVLFYTLYQQAYVFVVTIFNEILFRL
jgi:hypothetical protein